MNTVLLCNLDRRSRRASGKCIFLYLVASMFWDEARGGGIFHFDFNTVLRICLMFSFY